MTLLAVPTIHVRHASLPDELQVRIRRYNPKTDLGTIIKRALHFLPPVDAIALLDTILRSVVLQSQLEVRVYRGLDGRPWPRDPLNPLVPLSVAAMVDRYGREALRRYEDHGVTSRKVITNAGIDYLMADWAGGASDINLFKFHGLGTATTAEAATQTALTTEITTAYNPDNTRATGTAVVQAGPTPDTIKLSGTNTLDGAATIEEHGIFTAVTAGTMWDRSLTGTQTLSASDSLQSDYTLTANSGG
jgi:hypothetical protein